MGTTTPTTVTTPDLAAITRRQQTVWAGGDYAAVAALIQLISERLADSADLRAGSRVLDVAGGSGNTALAAARCGAEVVSLDYVPSLQERGRTRAAAEGLDVEYVEGDAQALPFPDASFDAVISAVGVMFAPDQQRVAAEVLRVCRPGGTIAIANWTPEGFIGGLLRTVGAHVPPPAGVASPLLWGTEEHVRSLLGTGVEDVRTRRRHQTFRFRSPEAFTELFREKYGPTRTAFGTLTPEGRDALAADINDLVRRFDRLGGDGPVSVPSEYLEVVATRSDH
jgi:ubiquinone/menaquinone biosynthesis C-methylase UbiE